MSTVRSEATRRQREARIRDDNWERTLYAPLRRFYDENGFVGKSVLIVGGSRGHEVPKRFQGTLVDIDFERCAIAHKDRPMANVVCADGQALPFTAGSYDVVIVSNLLSQLQGITPLGSYLFYESRMVYGELWRVLRPGGRLFVIDTETRTEEVLTPVGESQERRENTQKYFELGTVLREGDDAQEIKSFGWLDIEEKHVIEGGERSYVVTYGVKIWEISGSSA